MKSYFNSHTREGVTHSHINKCVVALFNFNSHTREGVTLKCRLFSLFEVDFNSHTREGVTPTLLDFSPIFY